ncbi:MAG: DUF6132 family protein [Candidatus Paceibacterota bacterium]
MIVEFLKKYKLAFIGLGIGALAGYVYYVQVGCLSGSCAITSSPINSTLYGALMGYLFLGMFKKEQIKKKI